MPDPTLSEAAKWCEEARKKLKLKGGAYKPTKGEANIKKEGAALQKNLKALQGLDSDAAASFEQLFIGLASQLNKAAEAGDSAGVAIAAEDLALLNLRVQVDLAKSAKKPDRGAVTKAENALAEKMKQFEQRYLQALPLCEQKLRDLRAVPYAVVTAVETNINEAKAAGPGRKDWAAAVGLLNTVNALFESAKKTAEDWKKVELKHAAQEQHYKSKTTKLGEVLVELTMVPSAQAACATIRKAQNAGVLALEPPSGCPLTIKFYDDGYKAIVAIIPKTKVFHKEALEAASKTDKAMAKDSDISKAVEATRKAMVALRTPPALLLTMSAAEPHELEISKAELLSIQSGKKEFGIKRLNELTGQLTGLKNTLEPLRTSCLKKTQDAENAMGALLSAASTSDERDALARLQKRLDDAGVAVAALEFQEADNALTQLVSELNTLLSNSTTTPDAMKAKWDAIAKPGGRLDNARRRIGELQKLLQESPIPGAKGLGDGSYADILDRELTKIENMAKLDKAWARAVTRFNEISKEIVNHRNRQKDVGKFITERDKLAAPVALQIKAAEAALQKLRDALAKVPNSGNTLALAADELAQAQQLWEDRATRAGNATELAADQALATFKRLTDKFNGFTASPEALNQAVADGRDDAAMKEFEQLAGPVEEALVALRQRDGTAAALHAKTLAGLRGELKAKTDLHGQDNPREKLKRLSLLVTEAVKTAQDQLNAATLAAKTEYDKVNQQLVALRKLGAKSLGRGNRDLFTPFFDKLEQELKDLLGMVNSPSINTAKAALSELQAMSARATKLQQEVEAQGKQGASGIAQGLLDEPTDDEDLGLSQLFSDEPVEERATPNFRLVLEAVRLITKSLEDANLATCLPAQKLQLDTDFTTLQESIYEDDPTTSFEALRELHRRVTETIGRAATAMELREQFKLNLVTVQQHFQTLGGYKVDTWAGKLHKLRSEPTAYLGELDQRIVAAKSLTKTPQKEQRALDDLAKIDQEMLAVISTDTDTDEQRQEKQEKRVEQEKAAQARAHQKELEKVKWKALVTDFENMDLDRATKAVDGADGGDDTQITDLKKMLKQAKGIFDDSGNFVGAVELLNSAKQYAARVIAHPMGLKAAARDELPKVRQHWHDAVLAFNNSVDAVTSAISSADDDIDMSGLFGGDDEEDEAAKKRVAEAVKKSVSMLEGLKGLFNANIMNAPIAVLTSDQKAPIKRAAREQAMQHVNAYKDLLRTDPVLLKLMQKDRPFGTVDFYGLNAALRDLDLNIQRAV
ncbi:hypothetical protein SNE35_15885 [Paucibacter sp. R3-3]|uniref:Uncharacterized protein n=1 Tax=Roseateles agri TaxID=3098619 RepID=A0ABU5DI73_9BURK|nr:hypothetical protein [Paucibacter sp. R3-3]MDY0746002.1 hypothetical protein [Paucibacter sp. R3-3]